MNRPSSCNHEDWPCCGCGEESRDELDGTADAERAFEASGGDHDDFEENMGEDDDEGPQMSDVEADADTLRSAGWGMDEDYGHDDMIG